MRRVCDTLVLEAGRNIDFTDMIVQQTSTQNEKKSSSWNSRQPTVRRRTTKRRRSHSVPMPYQAHISGRKDGSFVGETAMFSSLLPMPMALYVVIFCAVEEV